MAGYDEPQKIVTGLQLLNAEVIDKTTLQENLDGLDNVVKINERVTREKADKVLFESLLTLAQQGDPKATMALIQISANPANMQNILKKFYDAEKPEITEEEQVVIGEGQVPMPQVPQGPPPGIAQVLQGMDQ